MSTKQSKTTTNKYMPAEKVVAGLLWPRLMVLVAVVFLVLFGLIMIFSASFVEGLSLNKGSYYYILKQAAFVVVGAILMFVIWRVVPFDAWRSQATWIFFGLTFVAMFATLLMGKDALGARRWIYISGISIQPSEFAKIAFVLLLSKLYSEYNEGKYTMGKFLTLSIGSSMILLCFIFFAQSDLGTTIICYIGILVVLWFANAPKWLFILLIGLAVIGALFAVFGVSYRAARFQYLDPYNDGANGKGDGYQIIRSWYAFSQGGFFGVGLGNSHEKFSYLPEAETDFVFAIVGEETGFFGTLLVIGGFALFFIGGLNIVRKSKTRFGAGIAGAFTIMIVFQALLNISCVIGIAPVTGKPLPFISSGGSSVVATLMMVGFILAASEDDSRPDIYARRRNRISAVQKAGKKSLLIESLVSLIANNVSRLNFDKKTSNINKRKPRINNNETSNEFSEIRYRKAKVNSNSISTDTRLNNRRTISKKQINSRSVASRTKTQSIYSDSISNKKNKANNEIFTNITKKVTSKSPLKAKEKFSDLKSNLSDGLNKTLNKNKNKAPENKRPHRFKNNNDFTFDVELPDSLSSLRKKSGTLDKNAFNKFSKDVRNEKIYDKKEKNK